MPRHPPCALSTFFSILSLPSIRLSSCIGKFTNKSTEVTSSGQSGPQSARLLLKIGSNLIRHPQTPCSRIHPDCLLRKEVIQPHLPVRLPCYDFTPLTRHTFDGSFLTVRPPASGTPSSGGVTGGVYKARERIHRSLADLRLLAIPAS